MAGVFVVGLVGVGRGVGLVEEVFWEGGRGFALLGGGGGVEGGEERRDGGGGGRGVGGDAVVAGVEGQRRRRECEVAKGKVACEEIEVSHCSADELARGWKEDSVSGAQ